ncbi:hypothetical protein BB561_006325 [Smittium simulii]|uniref:NFACT RNA-binding domain-containing protein n=1 Tax=Smittium simulii TaxID=133385 RepID=A0A2T9Y512_9FUNG|nr:hypothetical protein BB561_006325 [Smittium simulii]
MVVVESGARIHSTEQALEKSALPSQFNIKLRKHLTSRRLTGIRQLGFDRIIDMEFSVADGPNAEGSYHLILEFYSSGNIILTNHNFEILSLLRVVRISDDYFMQVGQIYQIGRATQLKKICKDELVEKFTNAGPKDTLKGIIATFQSYNTVIAEHIALEAGFNPNLKVLSGLSYSSDSADLNNLLTAIDTVYEQIQQLKESQKIGYYILKQDSTENKENLDEYNETAEGYEPILLNQLGKKSNIIIKQVKSFLKAVDSFYEATNSVKFKAKANQNQLSIQKKLDTMKRDQKSKIQALENQQILFSLKARLISSNADYVEQVLFLMRSALAAEIKWEELNELVIQQRESGHSVAKHIMGLKLMQNAVTLKLYNADLENDKGTDVDIDLSLTPLANSQEYYNKQKQTLAKLDRTKAAEDLAFKRASKKILSKKNKKLQDIGSGSVVKKARKPMWFEAFNWFISSDKYLVVSGRDVQQNELVVRRFLKKDNVYVHADVHGATSVVILNHTNLPEIPISTLIQAGDLAICHSKAWDSKIITSAYWVNAHQVSKRAMTGEYLVTGSFVIRGKKNYLPPTSLTYGFGVLFKADEIQADSDYDDKYENENDIASIDKTNDNDYQKLRERYNLDLVDELGEIENSKLPSFLSTQPQLLNKALDSLDGEMAQIKLEEKSKKHLTGKQKRDKKKGKDISIEGNIEATLPKDENNIIETEQITNKLPLQKIENPESGKQSKKNPEKTKTTQATKNVGRRSKGNGKNKKNKSEFYDTEDEREKEIRDALLKGTSTEKQTKKIKKGVGKLKNTNVAYTNKRTDRTNAGGQENGDNKKGRINIEPEKTELEYELNESYNEISNETLQHLSGIEFNPNPRNPKRILQYAIPVCAPYGALSSYKYKIKLTPGDLKKGKSTKLAKHLFVFAVNKELELTTKNLSQKKRHAIDNNLQTTVDDNGIVTKPDSEIIASEDSQEQMDQIELANIQLEQRLLKSLGDNEMLAVMLGNVKISAQNLQTVEKSLQSSKKKSKKSQKK